MALTGADGRYRPTGADGLTGLARSAPLEQPAHRRDGDGATGATGATGADRADGATGATVLPAPRERRSHRARPDGSTGPTGPTVRQARRVPWVTRSSAEPVRRHGGPRVRSALPVPLARPGAVGPTGAAGATGPTAARVPMAVRVPTAELVPMATPVPRGAGGVRSTSTVDIPQRFDADKYAVGRL